MTKTISNESAQSVPPGLTYEGIFGVSLHCSFFCLRRTLRTKITLFTLPTNFLQCMGPSGLKPKILVFVASKDPNKTKFYVKSVEKVKFSTKIKTYFSRSAFHLATSKYLHFVEDVEGHILHVVRSSYLSPNKSYARKTAFFDTPKTVFSVWSKIPNSK